MYRPAREADLDAVEEMLRRCVSAMRAGGIDQWDDVYPTRKVLAADVRAGTLHLALLEGRIAGALALNDRQEPEYAAVHWTFAATRVAVVHRLMIHPDVQSRGVARGLMTHAEHEARARSFEVIRLDAFTGNPRALTLYDQLGYRRSGHVTFRKGLFVCFEKRLQG